jgi:hypothetical protein
VDGEGRTVGIVRVGGDEGEADRAGGLIDFEWRSMTRR